VFNIPFFQPLSVHDFSYDKALEVARDIRKDAGLTDPTDNDLEKSIDIVGGRLSNISKIAKAENVWEMAKQMLHIERERIQGQIGLISYFDDHVRSPFEWYTRDVGSW
jgi:hypothetical protein